MDFYASPELHQSHQSMLNFIVFNKMGLNLKFERAFVLVVDNILGLRPVTHYNGFNC